MTASNVARLRDRGVVRVTGDDAGKLLQGLITNDMELLRTQPAVHAGLLTPQGKILFEFFVVKAADGTLLETARERTAELVKRLTLYKLRARVDIADVSDEYDVMVSWNGAQPRGDGGRPGIAFTDPRLPALGTRHLVPLSAANENASDGELTADDYHAHRIAHGVPEGGKDYAFGETFPHEANLDQLHGVSFDKGCFVGQEIVSRVQHRSIARKRIVPITAASALRSGAPVKSGDATIGTVGSVAGPVGLALLRLDRAAEAASQGVTLTAGGVSITLTKPQWASFSLDGGQPRAKP